MRPAAWLLHSSILLCIACGTGPAAKPEAPGADAPDAGTEATSDSEAAADSLANVIAVEVSGEPGAYTLAVTLRSPDTGCDRYANWWEVLNADGELLYRRILGHSHVDEQPFSRSGGPVDAQPTDTLSVRAHMHPGGHGGIVFQGTAEGGFAAVAGSGVQPAPGIEGQQPQPTGCAF